MSSESELSDYESEGEFVWVEEEEEVEDEKDVEVVEVEEQDEEEEEEDEEEITPIAREIETEYQGWRYSVESNSYIFRGIDALVDIINHHNGNVDVFILQNSSIKKEVFLAARLNRVKNLSLYTPVQIFPVCPK